MSETTGFSTDYANVLFLLDVKVCEGGMMMGMTVPEGKPRPSIHEVIGALEYIKLSVLERQIQGNLQNLEKARKEKKEEEDDDEK